MRVKIGLASDSHGNLEALDAAFSTFRNVGVERVFFLGGRFDDVDALLARDRARVVEVGKLVVSADELGFLRAVERELAQSVARDLARAEAERIAGRVVRVASRTCPEWTREGAPHKVLEMVEGYVCCLVHDRSDLTREEVANAVLFFHGNSGEAALVTVGPRLFITPGHLRAFDPDGRPATFALVAVEGKSLDLTVYSITGKPLRQERAEIQQQSKVSVT